jgi:hypothetical protein
MLTWRIASFHHSDVNEIIICHTIINMIIKIIKNEKWWSQVKTKLVLVLYVCLCTGWFLYFVFKIWVWLSLGAGLFTNDTGT